MEKEKEHKQNNKGYEEKVKRKLDKIIEKTSNENKALKKILESLQKLNESDE